MFGRYLATLVRGVWSALALALACVLVICGTGSICWCSVVVAGARCLLLHPRTRMYVPSSSHRRARSESGTLTSEERYDAPIDAVREGEAAMSAASFPVTHSRINTPRLTRNKQSGKCEVDVRAM